MSSNRGRVLVAMSGGVDSSVAAALLKEQGYDVVGVTMQVWDYSNCDIEEGNGTCCSSVDVDDARAVADKIDIPFYVVNCESKFQAYVIDPFIGDYLAGRTPSPCVNCNTYLKFDHLVTKMKELRCDYLATGHYARIQQDASGRPLITSSEDTWKDQTYFLFTLNKDLLPKILFPVGEWTKDQVRAYAEERGLLNARKKDSVGICFVGNKGYDRFIEEQVASDLLSSGPIRRHPTGEVMGQHNGLHHYTVGQRKGLGIDHHESLFVLKLDPADHTLWVGGESYLFQEEFDVVKTNWMTDIDPGEELQVKIRFHHKGAPARISIEGDRARIRFDEPQRAITPGQAAAVYRRGQLVGGGWIA